MTYYGKIVRISFSSVKSVLLTYIGPLEVDKAEFPGLVDVLRENRQDKFFFGEVGFINIDRASRSGKSCVSRSSGRITGKSLG